MPHEIRLSWASRLRVAVVVLVTFVVGVIAATAGAPWYVRVVAAPVFLVGVAAVLDAVIFTTSWRMTATALEVPTLLARRRTIRGRDDLTVELRRGAWSKLAIVGPGGTRLERINPLVSGRDLRRWWESLPDR